MTDGNSQKICTIDENSECSRCELQGKLRCKFNRKDTAKFATYVIPFFFSGFFGMCLTGIVTGNWFFLIGYLSFLILFFTLIESRILCRHCPYYAKPGRSLKCYANEGFPKIWRYEPKPMNRIEKMSFIICIFLFGSFPIFTELYGIWYLSINYASYGLIAFLGFLGITIATSLAVFAWIIGLNLSFCSSCINFSCPFNKVPKKIVEPYLEKNPTLKNAWLGPN